MAAKLYSTFPEHLGGGDAASEEGIPDLLSDTIKTALWTGHTVAQTADSVYADISTGTEGSATGYTAGGYTHLSKTYDTASLVTKYDCADLVWTITSGTLAIHVGITYDDSSLDPADCLICYDDFGAQSVTGGDFTYLVHTDGIFSITVA
jgi:hypothetical protein